MLYLGSLVPKITYNCLKSRIQIFLQLFYIFSYYAQFFYTRKNQKMAILVITFDKVYKKFTDHKIDMKSISNCRVNEQQNFSAGIIPSLTRLKQSRIDLLRKQFVKNYDCRFDLLAISRYNFDRGKDFIDLFNKNSLFEKMYRIHTFGTIRLITIKELIHSLIM